MLYPQTRDEAICTAPLQYMRITHATPLGGYRLRLTFSNGASGEIDLATLIEFKGVLAPLASPAFFRQVGINQIGGLAWPGDLDLDSNTLYYATMHLPNPLALPVPA